MKDELFLSCFDSRFQQLIILPTEKCNFRCSYCYEDFAIGRMDPATIRALMLFIDSRVKCLDALMLSWFGGEPLLAQDIVFSVTKYAKQLTKAKGVKFYGSITTNAYLLTQPIFLKLCSMGVRRFQITLDGPREVHNKTRRLANGKGSFDRIINNITAIKNSDEEFRVVLRIHYSEANHRTLPEFLSFINNKYLIDKRFAVHLKSIENLGGSMGQTVPKMSADRREKLYAALSQDVAEDGLVRFDEYICYASKPNSLVIRADGSLAKCTVAFGDLRNRIGHLSEDGNIKINNEHLSFWLRGFESMDKSVLACPANASAGRKIFLE